LPSRGSLKKAYASCEAFFGNTKLKRLMYIPIDLVNIKNNIFFIKKSPDVYRDLNVIRI
jgi:hypothetical protein